MHAVEISSAEKDAQRFRNLAIRVGLLIPAFAWVITGIGLVAGAISDASPLRLTWDEIDEFAGAAILTSLWTAVPCLVIGHFARKVLAKNPGARTSFIGALVGAAGISALVWIAIPLFMMFYLPYDSDPPGTAQGWAALMIISPPLGGCAAAAGYLAGKIYRSYRASN